ncbi:MAG: cytidine deaminase [Hydrogenoanaerobacterium sp.]
MDDKSLIAEAFKAREASYSPYSGFMVGAALLCKNGKLYHGCNIENAAYSPTNCAERTAFFKAVSDGERDFSAIAIVGAPRGAAPVDFGYAYPCGVCRQVMEEFCDPDTFRVITARSTEEYYAYTLNELLPHGFGPADLHK